MQVKVCFANINAIASLWSWCFFGSIDRKINGERISQLYSPPDSGLPAEGEGKIRSFTISTGFVKTALALNQIPAQAQQRGISEDEVVREVMMGKSRTKEMMSPIEVANLFIFGFSRHARYLIGGDLLFDGGVVLTY